MNDAANDGSPPDFTDSDQAWYAALTGATPAGDATTRAAREGAALRLALAMRAREPDVDAEDTPEAMQHQLDLLQQRIARERVFEGAAQAPAAAPPAVAAKVLEFPWWRRRTPLLAAAASVLIAAAVVPQFIGRPDYPQPGQMLGADGIQAAHAAAPRRAAERLAQQLKDAGLRPGLYQRGKTYVVDITLMSTDLAAAAPPFAALGLAPATGFNRVEISAP